MGCGGSKPEEKQAEKPKPAEAKAKPAEAEAKPAEAAAEATAEAEAKPAAAEAEAKPAETEAKPAEAEAKPAKAEAKPAEVEAKPAEQKQSAKAQAALMNIYSLWDKNNDEKLTVKEIKASIGETGLTAEYFKGGDKNDDDVLSRVEFSNFFDVIPDNEVEEVQKWLLTKQSGKAKEMLLRVFGSYDKNEDGVLSLAELFAGIKESGLSEDYIRKADDDGDKQVTSTEFLQFFDPIPDQQVAEMEEWLASKPAEAVKA